MTLGSLKYPVHISEQEIINNGIVKGANELLFMNKKSAIMEILNTSTIIHKLNLAKF